MNFFQLFNGLEISIKFRVFIPILNFCYTHFCAYIFVHIYVLLANFEAKRAHNSSQAHNELRAVLLRYTCKQTLLNKACLYGPGRNDFDTGSIHYIGKLKGWALKIKTISVMDLPASKSLS
jgi:hypothetical protein